MFKIKKNLLKSFIIQYLKFYLMFYNLQKKFLT